MASVLIRHVQTSNGFAAAAVVRKVAPATLAAAVSIAGAASPSARGQCDMPVEVQKLIGSNTAMGDQFGQGVATDGERILVGAPSEDAGATDAGAAYIFARSGGAWVQEARLTLPSPQASAFMGALLTLSIEGDTAAVGADDYDSPSVNSGLVVIYKRQPDGTWPVSQTLTFAGGSYAGRAVRLRGDRLIVGARIVSGSSGRLHVFKRTGGGPFALEQTLAATPQQSNSVFGLYADLDGEWIVAAATDEDSPAVNAGAVYVFHYTGSAWTQVARIVAADQAANDSFGEGVSISGDTIAIGAIRDDDNGTDSGSIYIYVRDGSGAWVFTQKLTTSMPAPTALLGARLQLIGDTLLAGAAFSDVGATDAGAAYLFRRSAGLWTQSARLTASDFAPSDMLGVSVALAGSIGVICANGDDNASGADAGSAYVFDLDPVGLTIDDQPDSITTGPGQTVMFSAAVSGPAPITYQWRRDGVPVLNHYPFSGADTAALTISPTFINFGGTFDCVISNVCGSLVTTDPATLSVPECPGDADGSRNVTFADVTAVLTNFNSVCP